MIEIGPNLAALIQNIAAGAAILVAFCWIVYVSIR